MNAKEKHELLTLAATMRAAAARLDAAAKLLDAAEKARALIDQVRRLAPSAEPPPAAGAIDHREPQPPSRVAAVASVKPLTRSTPARSSRAFAVFDQRTDSRSQILNATKDVPF